FVAIHSVPRSGSTWLGSIFDSHPNVVYKHQPLFSYAFKDFLKPDSNSGQIDTFFRNISTSQDDFLDQVVGKRQGLIPSFQKGTPLMVVYKEVRYHHILRNMLEQSKSIKVVGLIRNPLAALYSW